MLNFFSHFGTGLKGKMAGYAPAAELKYVVSTTSPPRVPDTTSPLPRYHVLASPVSRPHDSHISRHQTRVLMSQSHF